MSEAAEKIHCETCGTYEIDYVRGTDGRLQLDVCNEQGHELGPVPEEPGFKGDFSTMPGPEELKAMAREERDSDLRSRRAGGAELDITPELDGNDRPRLPPLISIANGACSRHNWAVIRDMPRMLWHEEHGVYRRDADVVLKKLLYEAAMRSGQGKLWSSRAAQEVVNMVMAQSLVDRAEFDAAPWILNCRNGLVDLRTNKPVDKDVRSLVQIDTEFRPDLGRSELFESMVELAVGERYATMILEYMAASLTRGAVHPNRMVIFVGDTLNGKSTLLNAYGAVLGQGCHSSEELQSIEHDRFSAYQLEGKLANIATDINDDELEHFQTLKKLTTPGDRQSVQAKGIQPHDADLTAMLWFSCNELPGMAEVSNAVFRRLCIIPFNRKFEKNTRWEADLKAPEERSRILNTLLHHLQRLRAQENRFTHEQDRDEIRELLVNNSGITTLFINTMLRGTKEGERSVTVQEVKSEYLKFCAAKGKPERAERFNDTMKRFGYEQYTTRVNGVGESVKCWRDTTLIAEDEGQAKLGADGGSYNAQA